MRVFTLAQVLVTADLDQRQKLVDQSLTFDDTDAVTAATYQAGIVVLAPNATSQQFGFGSVSAASELLIVADDAIKVQLNSNAAPSVDVIPVPPSVANAVVSEFQRSAQPGLVIWRGKVTSLFLTNPSSSASARAFVAVIGNAA